jgi:hypothetical protein
MDTIYEELSKVMEAGDEKAAKDFIIKNLDKFPQEEQDGIIARLFEEALMQKGKAVLAVADFQKQTLAAAGAIDQAKEGLEKQAKLVGIKNDL